MTKALKTAKRYYYLTKPGIIRGNLLSVSAGFFIASNKNYLDTKLLFFVLIGSILVMSGACVFNNFLDIDIDTYMLRTQQRALVTKAISPKKSLFFGLILSFLGVVFLYNYTNTLTTLVGFIGFFVYVYIYTLSKRLTSFSTLIGAVSGAIPIVAGYTSVSGRLDLGAFLLFLILFFWQLPHFYSIAIFRAKEYKAANVPMISNTKGSDFTKKAIFLTLLLYIVVSTLPYFFGYTGNIYFIAQVFTGTYWIFVATKYYKIDSAQKWAKKIFGTSLLVLVIFTLSVVLDKIML